MKRGISDLIATVLLIVITVAAVGIIYAAIMPLIRGQIETSQKCSSSGIEIDTSRGYTCDDRGKGEVSIQVQRGESDVDIVGLQLQVSGGGKSKSIEINNTLTGLDYVKEYNYTALAYNTSLSLPEKNEARTYVINTTDPTVGITAPESVSVAPIVKIGNKNKICGISSQAPLSGSCAH